MDHRVAVLQVVWKTLSAASVGGIDVLAGRQPVGARTRAGAAMYSRSELLETLIPPGSVIRTAYGSVLVSPTRTSRHPARGRRRA